MGWKRIAIAVAALGGAVAVCALVVPALWVLAAISLLGAAISLLRPKHVHAVDDVILQEAA